jgi:hypothetical protein
MRRLALSLVSFLLTLLIVELGFRFVDLRGQFHDPRRDQAFFRHSGKADRVPFGFVPFAMVRSVYDSDPRGYFEAGNIVDHHFNSLGWRDVEHRNEKGEDVIRILGLGDSYLYGQGVRFPDICFSRQAGLLADLVQPKRIELINTAVNASNTELQRDLLQAQGLNYDPDLVVVHFVLNDVEQMETLFQPGPKVEFGVEYVATYDRPDWLSQYCYSWSWARQRWLRSVQSRLYIQDCLDSFDVDSSKWRNCRNALNDIRLTCDERNIGLLVVIFPFFHELNGDYPFQPIHDVVGEWCGQHDVHVLDLRDTYSDYGGPELWVHPTDQHPNEIAHQLASVAIADYLRDNQQLLKVGTPQASDAVPSEHHGQSN